MPTPSDIVQRYLDWHYPVVTWPQIGDLKGPTDKDWPQKNRLTSGYKDNYRYGLLLGVEVAPSAYLTDVDIDWEPGAALAQAFLPVTEFIFGHGTKPVSHCFYTTNEPLASVEYKDPVDKVMLIELRGTNKDGTLGHQTMVPPSVWSKKGKSEPLVFVRDAGPMHIEGTVLKQRVTYAAISMLLAKHFGTHGFGHEPRLAWSGFLLREGIEADDLIKMGEAISYYCDNREIADVSRVVKSTLDNLGGTGKQKKVKGGPSLAKALGEHGKTIVSTIREWLGKADDFLRVEGKILARNFDNMQTAITKLDRHLSYDLFSGKSLCDNVQITNDTIRDIRFEIETQFKFQPEKDYATDAIKQICWLNRFHPIKDYFATLTWDQTPRVNTWLIDYAGAHDSEYVQAVSAIVLIAAVRRIRHPGCKYDEMLVLESLQQGLNKSTALQTLCPRVEWFSDDLPLNVSGQRVIEATIGKWIVEASELVGRRADREHLKSMLSRQTDHARLAYEHFPIDKPREFIIIGTTNSQDYLNDPSGGRRFWPVPIKGFNVARLREVRDQLWAEACVREALGESIRLKEELWPYAAIEQEKRHESNPFEEIIRDLLIEQPVVLGRRRIASDVVWQALGIELKDRPRAHKTFSETMTKLGFRKITLRVEGEERTKKGYTSIEIGDAALLRSFEEDVIVREIGDEDGDTDPQSVVRAPRRRDEPEF